MNRPCVISRSVAFGSALALAGATLWTVLIAADVSVSPPPQWQEGTDFAAYLERYYAWQSSILGQERLALGMLCVGLLGVVATAVRTTRNAGTTVVVASVCIATGAISWGLTSLGDAGAREAISQMAASGNQIDPVNSIAYTIDVTADWLHGGASALLGVGLLTLGLAAAAAPQRAIGITAGLTAWVFGALLFTHSEASRYAGLALGAALLPLWMITTWMARDHHDVDAVDGARHRTAQSL